MKRKKILPIVFLVIVAILILSQCGDDYEEEESTSPIHTQAQQDGSWAIYWYLCGSNLESDGGFATTDLIEALEVDLPDNVSIIVETGGASVWMNDSVSPDKIQRWLVQDHNIVLLDEQPLANMGDEETLADFLDFAYKNYPAEKIAVTFWNHGGGSVDGAAFDELYGFDSLKLDEMYRAFASVWEPSEDNPPLELIGFDTCLMATVDVAYTFCDIAHYLVASEEFEPGNGWLYSGWLEGLAKNTSIDGAELGKIICDTYYKGCKDLWTQYEATLSVTDLTKIGPLIQAYETFGEDLLLTATENPSSLLDFARTALSSENYGGNTREQGFSNMVDLGHLARLSSDCYDSANAVLSALDECIVYRVNGPYRSEATGLSCFYSYDGNIDKLNEYIGLGTSTSFKYLYAYELTGQLLDGGQDYLDSLKIKEMPKMLTLSDIDWEDAPLEVSADGEAILNLGESAYDILTDIRFDLYCLITEDDLLLSLGTNNDLYADWEAGVFWDNFRGVWGGINGTAVYMDLYYTSEDYNLYAVPILLNQEDYTLHVAYDYNAEEWYILGATQGIDESGMASKDFRLLENGDEITILWKISSIYGDDDFEYYEVEKIVVDDDISFSEVELGDGEYAQRFLMTDIQGNQVLSQQATFFVENGDIYTMVY